VIADIDVERVASAGKILAPASSAYLEEDFVLNLFETVLDYQMQTTAVVKALEYFRSNGWREVCTLDDLDAVLSRYPDDQQGNTALAGFMWGNHHWTRAQQLRGLTRYFRSIGVTDQESLRAWAHRSAFRRDFEGRVKGLGPKVYQGLVMRQGVDTVKPDVHVRRFAEAAVGRPLSDAEVVEVVTRALACSRSRPTNSTGVSGRRRAAAVFPIQLRPPDRAVRAGFRGCGSVVLPRSGGLLFKVAPPS
jgi:hypothetical protein